MQTRTIAALATRAIATLGEEATPLDYVCDYVANGRTLTDLASELATEFGAPVSRQHVSPTAHGAVPNAKERLEAARRDSALAIAESAISLTDDVDPTPGAAARGACNYRRVNGSRRRSTPRGLVRKGHRYKSASGI